MVDERRDDEDRKRASEGVRIIGAEEAQAAIESGQVAGRRPDDALRFGDVPPQPEGPRPAIRFPLGGADPASVPRPGIQPPEPARSAGDAGEEPPAVPSPWERRDDTHRVERPGDAAPAGAAPPLEAGPPRGAEGGPEAAPEPEPPAAAEPPTIQAGGGADLPHWTEPPTGENPRIRVGDDDEDDLQAWQGVTQGPRWRDDAADWDDLDTEDPSVWAGDDDVRVGALDPDRPGPADLYAFEPYDDQAGWAEPEPEPRPRQIRTRTEAPREPAAPGAGLRKGAGRDVPTAVVTGVTIAGVLLLLLASLHNLGGVLIAGVVLTAAAAEFFAALRQRGFRPATLLGVVGTAATTWAAYARGEQAVVLLAALFVVFSLLWYLFGVVETEQPTANAAVSLLGFGYVAVLGSTAALMLKWPPQHEHGMGLFLGAIIATVAYDVGGFFVGSRMGRTRLAPAISPNKTWEGLLGGMTAAFLAALLVASRIAPWDSLGDAFWLGVVAAVAAPLGDLCESMIKRDLGVKDMGSILPGHGGVLDRIDAMLFVIPATYYLAKLLFT